MLKKEILQNQKKIGALKLIKRNFNIEEYLEVSKLNKIYAFIWSRRAGKTFFAFQLVKELLEKQTLELENICYIDFSWMIDKIISLEEVASEYFSLFPNKTPFFIFDEIQELEAFPNKLISLLNWGYKILITGSNAHLLSKELSTILRGKVYTKEVFPLDFKEYLFFKNMILDRNDVIVNFPKYKYEFWEFLKWGWFPELALIEDEFIKSSIAKSYLDVMIYKDLQDRYTIKNDFALKFFIKRVLSTFWKELNINKIYNELKGQNISLSKDSLYNFYSYIEDIYLISTLPNYWAQIKGTKKTYLIDTVFANFVWSDDMGKRFENFVYLELKRKYEEIFFLSKNYEIDFFIPSQSLYIQVVYILNYENIERETKFLANQIGKKVLIYFEKEDSLTLPESIEYVNFFEFLQKEEF